MQIEHIAIWTKNLEALKEFYVHYFDACVGDKYVNSTRGFESYFMRFESGARLEIMSLINLNQKNQNEYPSTGYAHMAFSVGSKDKVDRLTARLQADGFKLLNGPRTTGDGYYESVILDPDGNQIEITV